MAELGDSVFSSHLVASRQLFHSLARLVDLVILINELGERKVFVQQTGDWVLSSFLCLPS